MVNHLQSESSPYLLQHARNPVNWYPWSTVALTRARVEDKPIFLSIGYSACHWCHVMEHESFEDATIADFLNEHFVCIKVDREERPDLDQIYMTAVQEITGRGGWPMSVFLTPELQPFYGGTYFPPHARHGMPGFDQVLTAVVDAWKNRRPSALEQARQLTDRISQLNQFPVSDTTLSLGLLDGAILYLQRAFDREQGGFGPAPKFPHALDLQLLLRLWLRTDNQALLHMVTHTLDKMAAGGIYDQLGGGFARYSVDERWLVPHFEKMLYDNALLVAAYVESYLATGNTAHARVARETLDYVLREMTDSRGAFYCAEDADSEGEEGKYYVWTAAEIEGVLGADLAHRFCRVYDVTAGGNFEGHNILHLPQSVATVAEREGWPLEELEVALGFARQQLLAARQRRVPPGKDDKVIVSWNGLMIDSLSRAARGLREPRYLQAARAAAEFIHDQLWRDGRLLHCWRAGSAKLPAYLDDYTTLANALVSLYEASLEARWLQWALELMDQVLVRFNDDQGGALFYTADDHERLVARVKDLQDSSVPSGNAMAALALLRLAHLAARDDFRAVAERILLAAGPVLEQAPGAAGQLLIALDLYLGPVQEIAFVGSATDAASQTALQDLGTRFLPRTVLAHCDPQRPQLADDALRGLFQQRPGSDGQPTFYICHGSSCWEPARGAEAALRAWDQLEQAAKTER